MKKKSTEINMYRAPFWRRLKLSPFMFYFQYKHWREDGASKIRALQLAWWFMKFYLI